MSWHIVLIFPVRIYKCKKAFSAWGPVKNRSQDGLGPFVHEWRNLELQGLQTHFYLRINDSVNKKVMLGKKERQSNPCSHPNATSLIAGLPPGAELTSLSTCLLTRQRRKTYLIQNWLKCANDTEVSSMASLSQRRCPGNVSSHPSSFTCRKGVSS